MEQENRKYSILDEIAKCSGYEIALMTTFNFEIDFFERAILNRLYAKDVKTISLFVDAKELTNALNKFDISHCGSYIGRKYMVNPVKIDHSFHPKVILLLGEKKARLFIGSGNIKTSGYATNNEVFNYIDYDTNHTKYHNVIVAAIDFFDEISKLPHMLDNTVFKKIKRYFYYHKAENNGELFFLQNMKNSILEQTKSIVKSEVKSITIAVPYYDNELQGLQELKRAFPDAEVSLYVQNKYSTFPIKYNENNHIVKNIKTFNGFKDNTSSTSSNFYHGKVFLFKTSNKAFVLYGSANCTMSGLAKSYSEGGNIECDFLEVGEITDFDYFFDNINLSHNEEFTAQKMIYEAQESANFSFKYGEINEITKLHIGYSRKIDGITVKLNDEELEYDIENDELVVYINEERIVHLADIFEITVSYNEQKEILRCWAYDISALTNYRDMHNKRESLEDFEIECSGDKYIESRIKFLKAEATCLSEIQEYKNNLKYMNQIKMEQEEQEEPEQFIIDYQIPDEYRMVYRQYSAMSKIRSKFFGRFIGFSNVVTLDEDKKNTQKKHRQEQKKENIVSNPRKATSEEKSFEHFIKGKVKGMMNDVYIDIVELEHYIGLVQVIIEIFNDYCEKDPVEDIFIPTYVIPTKIAFMKQIIIKASNDVNQNAETNIAIIKNAFLTMLENYIYYSKCYDQEQKLKFEMLNRDLIMLIEKKYNLRNTYKRYIKPVVESDTLVLKINYYNACEYFEKLYGYKTFDMICKMVRELYSGAEIICKGTKIEIIIQTDNISSCFRPNVYILREISKYSKNVAKVNTVVFVMNNTEANSKAKNNFVEIRHTIDMVYRQWRYTQTKLNGEKEYSKSQYLSF